MTPSERSALARTEYHKGNAAFGEGRFTAARAHFLRALEAEESFDVLCNLGRTDAELRDDVSAAEHLRRGLRAYPTDPELAAARDRFAALLAEVEARLSDMQKEIVDIRVAHADAAAAAAHATDTEAKAEPPTSSEHAGGDVAADSSSRSSARLPVSLAVGGAGLIVAGVGVGFLIDSSSAASASDTLLGRQDEGTNCNSVPKPEACDDIQALNQKADRSLVTGAVLAGVGGGLLVGGLLTYLLWPDPADESAVFVRPTLHASPLSRDFSVGLRGRF